VPRTGATTQRGHRSLETGDESTAIAAMRSTASCLSSCSSFADKFKPSRFGFDMQSSGSERHALFR
jgi:hypothetical protein